MAFWVFVPLLGGVKLVKPAPAQPWPDTMANGVN